MEPVASKNIIYGLVDPITHELRYVGKSSIGIRRAKKHCWSYYLRAESANGQHSHKQRWILKLMGDHSLKPLIFILETVSTKDELDNAEIFWIAYYRSIGARLTNISPGGTISIPPPPRPKGYKHTEETKAKISQTQKNNPQIYTEEQKQRLRTMRLGIKAGPCPQETREKIRKAHLGMKATELQKLKQSKAKDHLKIRLIDQFGNKYDSIHDAAKRTNNFTVAIRAQLNNKNLFCKGFKFSKV